VDLFPFEGAGHRRLVGTSSRLPRRFAVQWKRSAGAWFVEAGIGHQESFLAGGFQES